MSKKSYAVYPGQIRIDNEVFFGIDYKITDFINEPMEQCKKQKEVIDKLSEIIYEINDLKETTGGYPSYYVDDLANILKEVK